MFFQDHEKQIYSPAGSDLRFDPLDLDRRLVLHSRGNLPILWVLWKTQTGDVLIDGVADDASAALERAMAEEQIVRAARNAFQLPDFPDCTDAQALEYLCDFLEWMRKKGRRGETPPASPASSREVSPAAVTRNSSACT
jgi:hypothetical protein